VAGGVTSAHLRIGKEALEQLKSDYLQLFMDRDLALKFVEDKEGEVEELLYQLSLVCSSPLTVETPSDLATMIQASVSVTHDMRGEPLVTSSNEKHSKSLVLRRSHDSESLDCACYRAVCSLGQRLKDMWTNWRNRNLPHPMSPRWGGSFCLGRLAQGRRPQ
jgi:hypothetical protein